MSWLLAAKLVGAYEWESAGFLGHSLDQLFDKS
jgi:hypothetical protein